MGLKCKWTVLHLHNTLCIVSTGTDRPVTMHLSRVGTNVYMVGKGWSQFPGLSGRVGEISNVDQLFDISPTLPDPCNRP